MAAQTESYPTISVSELMQIP